MGRACNVPKCKSNNGNQKEYTSVFSFPKDPDLRAKWIRNIHRGDSWSPGQYGGVCIKHFAEHFIIREHVAKRSDGTVLRVTRGRPSLTKDAYPTIFQRQPSYIPTLSPPQPVPSERRTRSVERDELLLLEDKNMDSSEYSVKRESEDAKSLLETLFIPMKTEPDFEGTSDVNSAERNLEATETVEDMYYTKCALEANRDGEEGLTDPLFVPIKCEPGFEETSEEIVMEENLEATENTEGIVKKEESESLGELIMTFPLKKEEYDSSEEMLQTPCSSEVASPSTQSFSVEEMGMEDQKLFSQNSCSSGQGTMLVEKSLFPGPFAIASCSTADNEVGEEEAHYSYMSEGHGDATVEEMIQKQPSSDQGKLVQRLIHECTDQSLFECSECGKAFKNKSAFNKHMRIHSEERPYKCNQCGKAFKRPCILASHMATHSEEKPFKCNQCARTFKRIDGLTLHMRIHSGEKPFKCSVCEKAFKRSDTLTSHMTTHSTEMPFKCSECKKAFRRNDELTLHIRSHTGEKPFQCSVCGKCFSDRSGLNQHMRIHTGEKPYKCDQCGKSFSRRRDCTSHIKTQHCRKAFQMLSV